MLLRRREIKPHPIDTGESAVKAHSNSYRYKIIGGVVVILLLVEVIAGFFFLNETNESNENDLLIDSVFIPQ
ncbi:MAG: hypothetical protein F4X82_00745 [Candidatus Spechtbacteria bacterium SB0662_bin_43]|uniref:Uncharacterized protein n=1 Tax=Candidatus Spechtbacteria bacterium SB0662_bin_43 TaxID=2604897 RepID=A0A845D958_9BACT|nr:hypothetical protein [Candidatus Spechtbacteria bacterium SB0662_bin_43]